ncbi:MAG: archaemetzincin family Zn-dependent metalloprotease [Nitrososphaerota archaeon]
MLEIVSEVDDQEALSLVAEVLGRTYGLDVKLKRIHLVGAEKVYNLTRRQYDAGRLASMVKPERGQLTLIVTDRDLYVPGLNYVFGYAPGWVALVSTRRLDQRFYGKPYDRQIFLDRLVKEAVHEVGHLIGLAHCPDRHCVMHFSNSILDTDIKSPQLCQRCRARL